MTDLDESCVSFERRKVEIGIKKPTQLCTEWSEFFRFAVPHGVITKGNNGVVSSALTRGHGIGDVVRNIPHSSINGWTTLVCSKHEHPFFHLPNTSEGSIPISVPNDFIDVNPSVLNAVLFFQKGQRDLDVLRAHRSAISFMRNFISKIFQALQNEDSYECLFLKVQTGCDREDSQKMFADSNLGNENLHQGFQLPKLGKVYAELRSCMKLCNEVHDKVSQCSTQLILGCSHLWKECFEFQGKVLLHVRWLIEARLRNIGRLVALQYENDEFDFDEIFSTNESKRFCKLLEFYNDYAAKHLKDSGMSEKELRVIFGDSTQLHTTVGDDVYIQGLGETHSTLRSELIYPLPVGKVLEILSQTFTIKVGCQVMKIFHRCRTNQQLELTKASNDPRNVVELGFLWEQASRMEMRPMRPSNHKASFFRVIKRIAGIHVPDLNSEEAGKECIKLARWLKKHERVVGLFISGIGGKTKILRRSVNLLDPYLSDDTMSVSSTSSRASSSLARYGDVKSVSWKDSWNNEAMKSITLSYIEFVVSSFPDYFWKVQSQIADDKGRMLKKICSQQDIDVILLHAVVSNLSYLNVMPDKLHGVLLNTCTELLIKSALSCSDILFCEMLGKTTPMFDKPTIQMDNDGTGVSLVTRLCIAAVQPLFHLLEFYSQYDTVARDVLPAIEIILNAGFGWIKKKIQQFFSAWDLPALLQTCLCDLKEITTIALDSLKFVEGCHNHIETRRSRDSATLALATKHLHNIDSLITTMQMTSGSFITQLSAKTKSYTSDILVNDFPPHKFWIQKNVIDCEQENQYIEKIIHTVLKQACSAVSKMDIQCQLASMTPVVTSVYEACLDHIASSKIKFTMQGAMQLSYDFSTIINFVTADISGLSHETRTSLSSLHSVKHALHVAQLLQSTSFDDSVDERFRPRTTSRSSPSSALDTNAVDDEHDDKFWLSLRKSNAKRSKTWTSLIPCMDERK